MTQLVAYYRVSTDRQGRSGLGLEAQQAAVRAHAQAAARGVAAEFTEVESGRKCNRPQLAAALAKAKEAGATLVVAKLDRLARDARFLLALADGRVPLHFLDLPDLNCDSAAGRMILTIMASFAEFESRRIGERVKAAFAAKRARTPGWKPGRKAGAAPKPKAAPVGRTSERQRRAAAAMHAADRVKADAFRAKHRPVAQALRQTMSLPRIASELNRLEVPTRRGKKWTPGLVWWLLK